MLRLSQLASDVEFKTLNTYIFYIGENYDFFLPFYLTCYICNCMHILTHLPAGPPSLSKKKPHLSVRGWREYKNIPTLKIVTQKDLIIKEKLNKKST